MTAECDYCGAKFERRSQAHRFCSSSCRFSAWVENHPDWPEKRRQTLREARARKRRRDNRREVDRPGIRVGVHDRDDAATILAKIERAHERKQEAR